MTNKVIYILVFVSKVLALVYQENTVQIMEVIEYTKGKKILLNGYTCTKKATKKNRCDRRSLSHHTKKDCRIFARTAATDARGSPRH